MPRPAGTRFGASEILGRLGLGGMGEVYRPQYASRSDGTAIWVRRSPKMQCAAAEPSRPQLNDLAAT
jgi:hypothetical protein